jgi:hypothetical protein
VLGLSTATIFPVETGTVLAARIGRNLAQRYVRTAKRRKAPTSDQMISAVAASPRSNSHQATAAGRPRPSSTAPERGIRLRLRRMINAAMPP